MTTEQQNHKMGKKDDIMMFAILENGFVKEFTTFVCWAYDDWEIPFEVEYRGYDDNSSATIYTPTSKLTLEEFESKFVKRFGYVRE